MQSQSATSWLGPPNRCAVLRPVLRALYGTYKMNYADAAKEYSVKFDFYFLALIFTILGLSVQTADFTQSQIGAVSELFGWVTLLCSGVIGLIRLERFPLLYQNLFNRQTYGDRLSEEDRVKYSDFIERQQVTLQSLYAWQRSLFVLGLFSVMLGRAIDPLQNLLCQ